MNVPAHRHWLGDPANGVQIGPRLCDNPKLQQAFNQFHFNIHHSFIPVSAGGPAETGGVIDSLGPQDGAPGLNNDHGGEIRATAIVVNGRGCGPGRRYKSWEAYLDRSKATVENLERAGVYIAPRGKDALIELLDPAAFGAFDAQGLTRPGRK